ncbi:MAG: hypothetical protein COV32_00875 [Candidatus Yonathbacteria bacterium CG10_big_fil_rev_8_21_14_0_10_43_136]|uniref:Uncharacterized protein n=2 Tax=Parcubacteria group TaxID=1794811 RepID=A0A2M7Q5U6_9BACT|nr:MAG: hypothetical protein AUK15_01245 [Candidatus Nomurabacteria bacterium CG2_30_43_9]PIR40841.1 MAG: hypothetical protein COV32_00875 [Candidatus Yonathbacteria bacterium CG10_big_fil_rev_8_21_14_0_10_43_136]PIX57270.1 MAG: hypothetical protein COZ48_01600 [Candidatus Yonathbacteria bacterium CG_4_10_14_3_um_filter_43_12]PIY58440.1 MAG: hypothetical protein COY98_01750 [Candidatus Yonathbacteria bacterium CG_4_10_14_0_8_um_filter_43_17]PJC22117.1 MAG: hypothetical protein CO060_01520 [Cand
MKRLFALIIVLGFFGGAFLGFSAMSHSKDGAMNGNCPITLLPASECPTEALSAATHYLSMYQAFTDGLISSVVIQVLVVTLLFVLLTYGLQKYLILAPNLFILSRDFLAKLYRPQALARWLSLLVNSPSFN